jgi:hypothetical protein
MLFTLYYMLAEPDRFTSSSSISGPGFRIPLDDGITARQFAIVFIIVFVGALVVIALYARRHRRHMRELGLDPDADAERYYEARFRRALSGRRTRMHASGVLLRELAGASNAPQLARADLDSPTPVPDTNDQPLSHYGAAWRDQSPVPNGWIAAAEFRLQGDRVWVRTFSAADGRMEDDGEVEARLFGTAERVQFIELRGTARGKARTVRFTGSDAGPDAIDVSEIQHPVGSPRAMSARSSVLRRR